MTRRAVPLYVAALLAALGLLAGMAGTAAADTTGEQPTLSESAAVRLAEADDEVREELGEHEGYTTEAEYEDGEWTVGFWTGSGEAREEVARAGVDDRSWRVEYAYTGAQVEWQMARGETGAYGKQANYWYVWGPLALAFALAFVRTDRLFSLRNLDVAALLGFLVSHGFFREGIVEEAVLLWYPPLLYLFARTLLMGFGIGERVEKTSNLPTWLLLALAALASALVVWLNLDSRVIDVGYAGVAGGDRIMDGIIPYGNMPEDISTGDTYGPLNYLLYVPFILMFGFSGEWDYLPAAHALTLFAFAGGALAMFFAGFKLSGVRVGAAMVFAWSVFPYTLYSANNNTNDLVVAAVAAAGLALVTSPIGRGVAVAAGFAIKLYPLLLAPLWMLHGGLRRRPVVDFVLGGLAVVIASFWVLALGVGPAEGARLFYEATLSFQGDRETPWTVYAQVPELSFLQRPLTVAVLVLAVLAVFLPRRRTVRRLAALSAALVIGFQLTVNYWFYPYITWFEPFVFLALLPATSEKSPLDAGGPPARKAPLPGVAEHTPYGTSTRLNLSSNIRVSLGALWGRPASAANGAGCLPALSASAQSRLIQRNGAAARALQPGQEQVSEHGPPATGQHARQEAADLERRDEDEQEQTKSREGER